jgi:hypothetical protein
MNKQDFAFVCKENSIDPEIALENETVRDFIITARKNNWNATTKMLGLANVLRQEF